MALRAGARVALEAVGVGKAYGGRAALRGVSLEIGAGEVLSVLGPNGAGKTTLLEILAGVRSPDSGRVAGEARAGWVPQAPALYGRLTVAENLRLFARLERVGDVEAAVARMLAQAGLDERADERVARLSGGARQRVNVAVGLLADPPVLLLDEPATALDPGQRARLWAFLAARAVAGTAIVASSHDVSEAERWADRLLVLARGAVAFAGTPAELRAHTGEDGLEAALEAILGWSG